MAVQDGGGVAAVADLIPKAAHDGAVSPIAASRARCDLCHLCQEPDVGWVKVASRGLPTAPILAIGEAPGYEESQRGTAFVGPAGQHCEELAQGAGVPADAVRWANTTACFPHVKEGSGRPSPRVPNFQSETSYCVGYLWDEIERLRPKVIVTLGAYATYVVTGRMPAIIKESGQIQYVTIRGREYPVVPCVHPSADLRSKTNRYSGAIQEAFSTAYDLTREVHLPVRTTVFTSTREAVSFLRGILERYRAGKISCIAYDLEWDTEMRRGRADRSDSVSYTDLYNDEKRVLMASFAYDATAGFSIPLYHPESTVRPDEVLPTLREVLSTVPVVCHNYQKAEGPWSTVKLGVTPTLAYDTMLASFVLQMKSMTHGLKPQTMRHLKWSDWGRKVEAMALSKPAGERSYRNVPLALLGTYSAIDPAATMGLKAVYEPLIEERQLARPLALLQRAARVFMRMELRAARIDLAALERLTIEYPQRMLAERAVVESYPEVQRYVARQQAAYDRAIEGTKRRRRLFVFNPTSHEHMGDVLYGEFGCVVPQLSRKETGRALGCSIPLQAGETMFPTQFLTRATRTAWIGDLHGDDAGERVRIDTKQSTPVMAVLKEPLRFDHAPNTTSVYSGSPPTDDKSLMWIMRQTECQACKGEGDIERGETTERCDACAGSGRRPEARQLFKFLSSRRNYIKISKILSGYVQTLGKFVIPGTNRLVFNYLLHGTHTGRLATREFAIHTAPDQSDIKRLFISEWMEEGGVMVSVDQSQVEMRIMASETGDPLFVNFFRQCPKCQHVGSLEDRGICVKCGVALGGDMHRMIASETFGKPAKDITADERSAAKAIGFGLLYGRGPESIAAATGMPTREAEALIARFFTRFARTKEWVAERHKDFRSRGYVTTSFGRRLPLADFAKLQKLSPEARKSRHANALEAEGCRQAQNYPIQSTASDITLLGVMNLAERLIADGFRSRVWGTTHDSVEIDVAPGELLRVLPLIDACMVDDVRTQCQWLRVPLAVDKKLGRRWNASVGIKRMEGAALHLKGKRAFFDELAAQLAKTSALRGVKVDREYDDPDELKMRIQKTYRGNTGGPRCVEGVLELAG